MSVFDLFISGVCGGGVMVLLFIFTGRLKAVEHEAAIGRRTIRNLENQLPAFLDMVSSGLSAGNSLPQALEASAERAAPPLSFFAKRAVTRVRAGMSLEKSLTRSAEELKGGFPAFAFLSLSASYRSGGDMSHSLSLLAEMCRERQALHEKILARTAQSRMQGTVTILVPVFFLVLLFVISPQNLSLVLSSPVGRKILLAAFFLQFGGALIIRRMIRQDIL